MAFRQNSIVNSPSNHWILPKNQSIILTGRRPKTGSRPEVGSKLEVGLKSSIVAGFSPTGQLSGRSLLNRGIPASNQRLGNLLVMIACMDKSNLQQLTRSPGGQNPHLTLPTFYEHSGGHQQTCHVASWILMYGFSGASNTGPHQKRRVLHELLKHSLGTNKLPNCRFHLGTSSRTIFGEKSIPRSLETAKDAGSISV